MFQIVLGALVGLVVEETVRAYVPRYLKHAWLVIIGWATYEALGTVFVEGHLMTVYGKTENRHLWISYCIVALCGALLFLFYWWILGKAFTKLNEQKRPGVTSNLSELRKERQELEDELVELESKLRPIAETERIQAKDSSTFWMSRMFGQETESDRLRKKIANRKKRLQQVETLVASVGLSEGWQREARPELPDVSLTCNWPETPPNHISDSWTVRNRLFIFSSPGMEPVYNVQIQPVEIGDYVAVFDELSQLGNATRYCYPLIQQRDDGKYEPTRDIELCIVEDMDYGKPTYLDSQNPVQANIPLKLRYRDKFGSTYEITYELRYDRYWRSGKIYRTNGIRHIT